MSLSNVFLIRAARPVFDRDGRCLDPAMESLVRRAGSDLTSYIHHHICPAMQLEQLLRQGAKEGH